MRPALLALSTSLATLVWTQTAAAQGFVLPSVGPVNRSMGGAGTAAPLDATGALHWNPASITALPSSRLDIGVDLLMNRNGVDSSLVVPFPASGSSDSRTGVIAMPAIGLVYQPDESPWTWGLGLNAVGGFSVNFPGSTTNPIFMPPPPAGVGIGPAYSRLAILQLSPTVAFQITDRLSIGVSPTVNVAEAQARPFPFTPPDDANGDGFFTYPDAIGGRNRWGLGVQGGVYYEGPAGVNLGFSIKSPQWFERFEYNATDELGFPRRVSTQLEYPMIVSLGAAYAGIEHVLLAVDVRWIDFASTKTFGDPAVIGPDGALRGLGWRSVWMVATGAQVQVTERLALRAGYSYNENPIPPGATMYNILAPGIFQHVLSVGASLQVSRSVIASLAWVHGFHTSMSGPFRAPPAGDPVPLSRISLSQEIDSIVLGVSVVF